MSKAPFSNEAFLDWLQRQPPDGHYWFLSNSNCAIAQYLHSLGFSEARVSGWTWREHMYARTKHRIPRIWNRALNTGRKSEWFGFRGRFGLAAERLKRLMAEEAPTHAPPVLAPTLDAARQSMVVGS